MKFLLIAIVIIHFIDYIILSTLDEQDKLEVCFGFLNIKAVVFGFLKLIEYILIVIALIKLILMIF